jgi:trans-2,3-dihydro-3-hydroxyanthranilate isomerase
VKLNFVTADVFTDRVFGGNPLAVILDGRGVSGALMQRIAREFNLSETVFVLPPDDPAHTRRVRIFTPVQELPFAGHPTVGTALVLAELGLVPLAGGLTRIILEEDAGPVPVTIRADRGRPVAAELEAPQAPEIRDGPEPSALAAMLGLAPSDLVTAHGLPAGVSCGVPFTIVEVTDRGALARARLDRSLWEGLLGDGFGKSVLVVTRDAPAGYDLQARMYAAYAGIDEDPATGSAAAALGGFLGSRPGLADGIHRWLMAQGIEMGRPSRLEITAERQNGELRAVRVAGAAVRVMAGTLTLGDPG